MMHLIHTGRCLSYISDTVQLVADHASRTGFRSASASRYIFYQDCAVSLGSAPSRSVVLRPGIHFRIDFIRLNQLFLFEKQLKSIIFNQSV